MGQDSSFVRDPTAVHRPGSGACHGAAVSLLNVNSLVAVLCSVGVEFRQRRRTWCANLLSSSRHASLFVTGTRTSPARGLHRPRVSYRHPFWTPARFVVTGVPPGSPQMVVASVVLPASFFAAPTYRRWLSLLVIRLNEALLKPCTSRRYRPCARHSISTTLPVRNG